MSVFLAMALGRTDAAPSSSWFWRPHMTLEANSVPFLWLRPKQNITSGIWRRRRGGSRALGGCLGHAAERQSCLQRDVINYSETALKGTQCGRWSRCRPASSLSERDFSRKHARSSLSSARGRLYNASAERGTGLPCVFFCFQDMAISTSGYNK